MPFLRATCMPTVPLTRVGHELRVHMTGLRERGFWVQWANCPASDDTWEPESGLPADMVADEIQKASVA